MEQNKQTRHTREQNMRQPRWSYGLPVAIHTLYKLYTTAIPRYHKDCFFKQKIYFRSGIRGSGPPA